jgi:hypothetical protein
MRRFVAGLPFLLLIFPIPHLWLVGRVTPTKEQWRFRDVGGTYLLVNDTLFVLFVLALLKLPKLRYSTRWAGGDIVLGVVLARLVLGSKDLFNLSFFGSWMLVLVLAGLWLRSQRRHLD